MKRPTIRRTADLVLVGGGHAHVQVLKSLAMEPVPDARVSVVVDRPIAVYSGMVPGFVGGQYRAAELEIDIVPLARLAGARVILAPATGIDPAAARLELEGRPPIPYDVVSFDIGSTVAGLDTPGVREHAVPTRPIGRFVERVDRRIEEATAGGAGTLRVAVVGAGAGGVELAFSLRERLRHGTGPAEVSLFEAGPRILPGHRRRFAERVAREARRRGISIETGRAVEAVEADAILAGGERLAADLVVWVSGAAPVASFRPDPLPTDREGFLRVGPSLRVEGQEEVFAAGDCAHLVDASWVPKAGVYAVRQGPVLTDNLRRALADARPFRSYRPQRDFLTLLNLGDGTAVGGKWGLTASGRWVFRWKDWIDRRFMRRFQALDEEDSVTSVFSGPAAMRASMDILCGGCAAKLGQSDLERALGRLEPEGLGAAVELGIEHGDDVAAYASRGGTRIVSSVDQFRAFTDDPWLVGRVGAVNAASDVFAKGLRPEIAQAIIALPESAPRDDRAELLYQVLAGARRAFDEMGVTLVGGHTTTASELLVGFHVEGFAPPDLELLAIGRLEPGRTLVLTKGLGTGVIFHADMLGRARGPWLQQAIDAMLRPNARAAHIARAHGATAATDVTGFGLARHLAAMLRASGAGGIVDVARLPRLAGVSALLGAGLRSTFHEENERAARGFSSDEKARSHESWPLLFDPQTSGGLLFGVPPERAGETLAALWEAGFVRSAAIGETRPRTEPLLHVTVEAESGPGTE